MRVTKAAAAQNRTAILDTATRLFKTGGIDGVSIADLTKAAGFTHGGFYNHFDSKADLVVESIRHAFDQALGEIARDPESMTERLATYLSPDHRDEPAGGCPTGSLPVDAARQPAEAQHAFAEGLERYIALIEPVLPPGTRDRRAAAITDLATLVGGIILSRAVRKAEPGLSDEILRSVGRGYRDRTAEA